MKKKLVLWGTGAEDEKLLLAIELLDAENKIRINTFPENIATEDLYNNLMDKWRMGQEVQFPEGASSIEKPLSITEGILPEHIKVERTDLINRAKTEWHFVVLSSKLFALYKSELEDLKDRVQKMAQFESGAWEELKGFWAKVQQQTREKNLFREHANTLRDETNSLFDSLKVLRKKLDKEYQSKSEETKKAFMDKLNAIQENVEKGLGLGPIFNELKSIQNEFRNTKFTKEDREKVWKKLDSTFKQVKEKRFGKQGRESGSSSLERVTRRYEGLIAAIAKMKNSIGRDQNDIAYQGRIIQETDGQLEQQIRQAKIKMIEERIASKNVKLEDMLKTQKQLEQKIESLKAREEKDKEREKIQEAKEQVKERIAQEIKEKNKAMESDEKIQAAANSLKSDTAETIERVELPKDDTIESSAEEGQSNEQQTDTHSSDDGTKEAEDKSTSDGTKEESIFSAITTTIGESLEDVVDTVKAVAEVVGDKVEEKIADIKSEMTSEEE